MSTSPVPTQSPSPSQSFHYPGCLNLSIVQHNCLGSSNVFQTLFSFFTSVESSPHIVALQDIPLWRNCPPVFRNYKCFFPPATDSYKPRVATYVHERLLSVISILPLFFERGDLMAVNFHSPEGLFDTSQNLFHLYNSYSIPSGHTRSVSPVDLFPQHDFPTLVLGDFNIHHSASDPTRVLSNHNQFISSPYFDRASALLFSLLNTPGVYTRFPFTSDHRPAVLDLSFANTALLPFFSSWTPPSRQLVRIIPPSRSFSPLRSSSPHPRALTGGARIGISSPHCSLILPLQLLLLSPLRTHSTYGSMTAWLRSRTLSPPTRQPNSLPPTLNRGGLLNLHSYDGSITIPPDSLERIRPRPPWPVWLETHTSRLSNLPKGSTGGSFWPMSTRDQSGMLEKLRPVELLIGSPLSRTPPPQPKSTTHSYSILFLQDPLLLLP